MRKGLFTSIGLAGLLAASLVQGAVAAPIVPPATLMIAPYGDALEQVYYHQGRYYRYHHHGRYYAHRVYRHGHWHYY